MAACDIPIGPDLEEAFLNLGTALQMLTDMSLKSAAEIAPGDDEDAEALMGEHYRDIAKACSQLKLGRENLNPRFNKSYGRGGTCWCGNLQDGKSRGWIPYFCPNGWVRFSLNVCPDNEFESRYGDWGYLYHGTKGRHVGPILASGFRGNDGCFCGKGDAAIYMSPSIEYSGHPRYACIEYNPERRCWIQIVLQCRVNPAAVWKRERETLSATEHGVTIDENIPNTDMEWLLHPNYTDPETGYRFAKDTVICTGVMLRITNEHPQDLNYWWTRNHQQIELCERLGLWMRVNPLQKFTKQARDSWQWYCNAEMWKLSYRGDYMSENFEIFKDTKEVHKCWLAPQPFAKGGMRYAYYLYSRTPEGESKMYVAKRYNTETVQHIRNGLGITCNEAILKEVATYLVAQHFAEQFNEKIIAKYVGDLGQHMAINFVDPLIFVIDGTWYFAEEYVEGNFIKWNNNCGFLNDTADALKYNMHVVAATFCHFVYQISKGAVIVVDIQGWVCDDGRILFTDPQIHARSISDDVVSAQVEDERLAKRFSLGNLGRVGMLHFFHTHECTPVCRHLGYLHPLKKYVLVFRNAYYPGRESAAEADVFPREGGVHVELEVEHWMKVKHVKRLLRRKGLVKREFRGASKAKFCVWALACPYDTSLTLLHNSSSLEELRIRDRQVLSCTPVSEPP